MSISVTHCDVISAGLAEGSLCFFDMVHTPKKESGTRSREKPETEINRFKEQVASLVKDLGETVECLESESLSAEADVIRAHITMLQDPIFHARVQQAIARLDLSAESAVQHVIEDFARVLGESRHTRLAERASDMKDLAMQLKAKLSRHRAGFLPELLRGMQDPVLAVPELVPSVVLDARRNGVKGFLVEKGTAFSHGAILAKSFALPALRMSSLEMLRIYHGTNVLVDAVAGELLIEPEEEESKHRLRPTIEASPIRFDHPPPVRLWVNIASPVEALSTWGWWGAFLGDLVFSDSPGTIL